MIKIILTLFLLCLGWIDVTRGDGDLLLTPLIKSGDFDKAKAQAEDSTKAIGSNIKSYSGYLTIDEKTNSNLFFWFFPAQQNPDKAPVILWVNEIPGFSSLKGIFLETGPFMLDENNKIGERNATWTKTQSVLYIDSPPGTGFSFTDAKDNYAQNSDDDADEIYEALTQFFTLFKEYQGNDFYLAGENYAASFIPFIARHIDTANAKSALKINLKGFIIGSPLLDQEQNLNRASFLYNVGLVDEVQRDSLDKTMRDAVNLVRAGKPEEGSKLGFSTIIGPESLFAKYTGFKECRSALTSNDLPEQMRFQKFIDTKEVHNYLHVGLHKFSDVNFEIFTHFVKEIVAYHGDALKEMLDKGMRVLLYAPQFDVFLTANSIYDQVKSLKWKGTDSFAKAPRKIWRVNNNIAGYTKTADNLSYALIRNAGNYAIRDQPEWMLDLVQKFLQNKELV